MATFSQRYGYIGDVGIQLESINDSLRNRLWNKFFSSEYRPEARYDSYATLTNVEHVMDRMGLTYDISFSSISRERNIDRLKRYLFEGEWFQMYDFLEKYISLFDTDDQKRRCRDFNKILENECSGYRFINNLITPISNSEEIKTIEKATTTKYSSVSTHLSKALGLFSNRKKHDYENAIKESISAVEALCCVITQSKNATLHNAINKLETNGIKLHPALLKAIDNLYGYASDEGGIRHGSIDFAGANSEDAKFMLVSCSAFVNYLIEKWEKIK